ncbi:hypothetical protein MRY87_07425 [bacterium]|nr:hypothetical protein [bacterium]
MREQHELVFDAPVSGQQLIDFFDRPSADPANKSPFIAIRTEEGMILGLNSNLPKSSYVLIGSSRRAAIAPTDTLEKVTLRLIDWIAGEGKLLIKLQATVPQRLEKAAQGIKDHLAQG